MDEIGNLMVDTTCGEISGKKVCMMIGKYRICQFAGMSILVLSKHQRVQILNKAIIIEYVETLSSREREREREVLQHHASPVFCISN